jgi:peroxiredoxin
MVLNWFTRLVSGGGATGALEAGTMAPPFSLPDVQGRTYSLPEALSQGPVLLAFFKVGCPVCQFTFPFLERLHRAVRGHNQVRIWGISQDDTRDTQEFAQEYGCTFPLLLDEPGYYVSNAYGLTNVPTLFLVQPDSKIQLATSGFDRKLIEQAAAEFVQLTGKAITVFHSADLVPDYQPG